MKNHTRNRSRKLIVEPISYSSSPTSIERNGILRIARFYEVFHFARSLYWAWKRNNSFEKKKYFYNLLAAIRIFSIFIHDDDLRYPWTLLKILKIYSKRVILLYPEKIQNNGVWLHGTFGDRPPEHTQICSAYYLKVLGSYIYIRTRLILSIPLW